MCGAWIVAMLLGVAAHAVGADNGDGTYTNPPLFADYPDLDVIRVGERLLSPSLR